MNVYYRELTTEANVTVTKTGNNPIEYGQEITYKFSITTTGDEGQIIIKNPKLAEAYEAGYITLGNDNTSAVLTDDGLVIEVGENGSKDITFEFTVKAQAGSEFESQFEYTVNGGATQYTDLDKINVEKTITITEKITQGSNVVVLIDQSSSMNKVSNSDNKIGEAKDAAADFVTKLFEDGTANGSTVSVFTFGTRWSCKSWSTSLIGNINGCNTEVMTAYADPIGTANDTASAATLATAIGNISENADTIIRTVNGKTVPNDLQVHKSGTPYYIALQQAYNTLSSYNNGNKNVVIFLTDGKPTTYNTTKHIYDNESTADKNARIAATNNLESIGTIRYAIKYALSTGDESVAHSILESITGKSANIYPASTGDLSGVFTELLNKVREINASNQTIRAVAEMSQELLVDADHPFIIKVNGTQKYRITSESDLRDSSKTGEIIKYNSTDGYSVNALAVTAGDKVEIIYYLPSTANRSRLSSIRSLKKSIIVQNEIEDEELESELVQDEDEMLTDETQEEKEIETEVVETEEPTDEDIKEETKEEVKEDESNTSSDETSKIEETEKVVKDETEVVETETKVEETNEVTETKEEEKTTSEVKTEEVKQEEKKTEIVEEVKEEKKETKVEEVKETVKEETKVEGNKEEPKTEEKKETTKKEEKSSEKKETTKKEEKEVTTKEEEKTTEVESKEETE